MKMLCHIALAAVIAGTAACAQSNTNSKPEMLRSTDIYSDSADYYGTNQTVVFRSNVCLSNANIKLTCALLIADLPQSGGRLSHAVAETNVVVDVKDSKGQTVHATGDKAVYDYNVQNGITNDTITLTGNPQPQVTDSQGTTWADVIVWDRANNIFRWLGNYHVSSNTNRVPAGTNAPAATTNDLTMRITNSPPGTIEDIDRVLQPQGQRGF